jgi:hypothetical protein
MKNEVGVNINNPVIAVYHSSLSALSTDSLKVQCPFCKHGTLVVRRDINANILPDDRCLLCGQAVNYLDYHLIGI